jgi:hypothetical protein
MTSGCYRHAIAEVLVLKLLEDAHAARLTLQGSRGQGLVASSSVAAVEPESQGL